jgi:TP901 family phage tail tape measure protein
MKAFTIPTIYTVIDKMSAPFRNMTRNAEAFASRAEAGIARADRAFRRLTPALGSAANQFLSFASTAAIAGAIIAGVNFTTRQIVEYEDALASFRTIVGGTNEEFAKYEEAARKVGIANRKSAVDVVKSFETIAGLNAEFAKTPEAISAVAAANITLSKASRMSLDESAANMVGIMNQFNLGAEESNRVINVLAAGQAVGAANIAQTAEAFKNFGSVAKGANITLEQSVGLIQTLGKFSVFGAEAGTKLRGSVLKLQQAGLGYKSGQFQINDALEEARKKVDKLATSKQKDAAILKMFGAENISTGKILLANVDLFNQYTAGVTATDEAQKAAAINSGTFTEKLKALSATWTNIVLNSDKAGTSLSTANAVIEFLIVNLETIVSIGLKVLLFFAAWKVALLVAKAVMIGYNIALGVMGALSGVASIAIAKNAVALGAYKFVLGIATAAQWAWNAALTANPIGLIIVAIAALIGSIILITKHWNDWGAALSMTIPGLGTIISMVQSFRRNWDAIGESFKTEGWIAGIKKIGVTILDALIMPLQQLFELISKIPGMDWAGKMAQGIEINRRALGANVDTDESGNPLDQPATPAVNPEAVRQEVLKETINTQKQQVGIEISNKSDNNINVNPGVGPIQPVISSTMPPNWSLR